MSSRDVAFLCVRDDDGVSAVNTRELLGKANERKSDLDAPVVFHCYSRVRVMIKLLESFGAQISRAVKISISDSAVNWQNPERLPKSLCRRPRNDLDPLYRSIIHPIFPINCSVNTQTPTPRWDPHTTIHSRYVLAISCKGRASAQRVEYFVIPAMISWAIQWW